MEIREVRYFVACVQTGSFSRAAELLFTTQSSVSKVIKAMEDELGVQLFERTAKGIRMTAQAERIYPHAQAVLDNLEKIRLGREHTAAETLSLSCNPSSWFADTFVRYYEMHQGETVHYQVYSADSREVAERVRERIDDMGFVYIMKNQLAAFQFFLSRNYLEFIPLKETGVTLYPGGGCRETVDFQGAPDFSGLRLIQRFPDEFSPDNYWNIADGNGRTAAEAETVITTNSDYIMERILQFGNLVNISGGYLSGTPRREVSRGIALTEGDQRIAFGCVMRKGEELSRQAEMFLSYVKKQLAS